MRKNKLEEELNGEPLWGLPKRISDELVDSYRLKPIRWLGHWLFIIIMIGGFAGGAIFWGWCDGILSRNAIKVANTINGFAYDTNFGIGLLIGLFVWIFLCLPIYYCIIRIMPMPYKGTLFLVSQMSNSKENPDTLPKKPKLDLFNTPHSAEELINNYLNKVIGKSLLYLSPFILLVGFVTQAELTNFTILSPSGIYTSGFFSKNLASKRWRDAEAVKLGCNQTDDGSSLIYEVIWPDGKDKRLPTDTHINGEDWLTNLETVDAEISKGGAVFQRWVWLKRNPMHPKCLRGFYAGLSPNEQTRFNRLLRIGELD